MGFSYHRSSATLRRARQFLRVHGGLLDVRSVLLGMTVIPGIPVPVLMGHVSITPFGLPLALLEEENIQHTGCTSKAVVYP